MQFAEAVKLALQSLWGNKMRTILTLIGVVMGVASVIMVITLVNGANTYVATKLTDHGADVFTVTRQPGVIMGPRSGSSTRGGRFIRFEDYQAIEQGCTECSEVGAMLERGRKRGLRRPLDHGHHMRGMTWTMISLNRTNMALGRGLTRPTTIMGRITRWWATTLWTTCWGTAIPSARRSA